MASEIANGLGRKRITVDVRVGALRIAVAELRAVTDVPEGAARRHERAEPRGATGPRAGRCASVNASMGADSDAVVQTNANSGASGIRRARLPELVIGLLT